MALPPNESPNDKPKAPSPNAHQMTNDHHDLIRCAVLFDLSDRNKWIFIYDHKE